jgi:phosphate-selective porin OprO and OprP
MDCSRWIVAALVVGLPYVAMAAEPSGEEAILFDESAAASAPAFTPARNAPRESGPLWPHTWHFGPEATLRLRGRIDTDAIWASQSAANQAAFGDLGDEVGLRRARLGVEGKLGPDRRYEIEIDLASGVVVPRDIFYAFGARKEAGETQLGHFREPFSLEGGTSARHFAFLERSPINLLDPARNWGLGWFHETSDMDSAMALGVYHAGAGTWDFQSGVGSTVDFTGRLTSALVNEDDGRRLLHLGVSLSERVPEHGMIVIKQQPRSPLLDLEDSSTTPFVPNIQIPAGLQQLANLQFAAARGSLWTQAEWYGSLIDQTGGGLVYFHGYHVDCGYFLTGEHRRYDRSSGNWGAVRVDRPVIRGEAAADRPRGCGAWELTARFAYLDFIDSDTPLGTAGERLGTCLSQSTAGVNWYLSDRMRLMLNYSYVAPDDFNGGAGAASTVSTRLTVFW